MSSVMEAAELRGFPSQGTDDADLKNMILNFRVSELQVLLGFAGRNKSGKKQELQQRALELVRVRSNPIILKIKDLHRRSQGRYGAEIEAATQASQAAAAAVASSASLGALGGLGQVGRSTVGGVANGLGDLGGGGGGGSLSTIPQSRICAVPPMKRDDPPSQHTTVNNYLQRQAAALSAAGLYPFQMAQQVASSLGPASVQSAQPPHQYPIHPDVKFKVLPFYEQLAEILKPSSLQQNIPQAPIPAGQQNAPRQKEAEFAFHMTPAQVHSLLMSKDYKPGDPAVQLQLRLCALDSTCPQDDAFPPGLVVKVNGRLLPLPNAIPTNKPGVEPKRPPRPLNITTVCHTNTGLPNKLHISWTHEYGKAFVCAVYLVQRHNANALLERLKKRGRASVEATKSMIRAKLRPDGDDDLCMTSLRLSLVCPLGQCRVQVPCRARGCSHLNCFDAHLYLMMNEKKPTWICAVCDKSISYDDLYIDAYMEEVCRLAPPECREVQLNEDGSWTPVVEDKDKDGGRKRTRHGSESEDSDDERERKRKKEQSEKDKQEVMIDLTESTDEEDNAPPPARTAPALVAPSRLHQNSSQHLQQQAAASSNSGHSLGSQRVLSSHGIASSASSAVSAASRGVVGGIVYESSSSGAQGVVSATAGGRSSGSTASLSGSSRTASTAAAGFLSNYSAAVAASGTAAGAAGYYGSYSTDYFNAIAAGGGTSVGQNLYGPYGSYNIYQLLNEERQQRNQQTVQSAAAQATAPRDVINLD